MEKYCFVAIEYPDDPNVAGLTYWYLCPFDGTEVGDEAIAPLGRHNNLQRGIVRRVTYETARNAPFPLQYIKSVRKIIGQRLDDV